MSNELPLSYKKKLTGNVSAMSSNASSPIISSSSSPKFPSTNASTRNVSSRRKALQDFYHIQKKDQSIEGAEENSELQKEETFDFKNSAELDKFIKSRSMYDILKLRNSISGELNSHDSEKKSIIYDNYYELIKLNQILQGLSSPSIPEKLPRVDGLGIFTEQSVEANSNRVEEDYIESTLNDLAHFIKEESTLFNSDFESVIQNIQYESEAEDSTSSIKGIKEQNDKNVFSPQVNKVELIEEINSILDNEKGNTEITLNKTILEDIQCILENLDMHRDELLILQLADLKKKYV